MRNANPLLPWLATALLTTASLTGCASLGQDDALHRAQYDWSAAIRWGDFEGAWTLVDPAYREQHPLTDLELARYEQIRISAYRTRGARADEDSAQREIQIGVINRHTLTQRDVRYTEHWRWDAESERWWIGDGLPNLWQDE